MKAWFLMFGCSVSLAIIGCGRAEHPSLSAKVADGPQANKKEVHSRLETIAYRWEGYDIEVSFYGDEPDLSWTVTVRDAWDVWDHAMQEPGKGWDQSACKCSTEELSRIIDRSLADFEAERPGARLDALAMEMHLSRDLWAEILARVGARLSRVEGRKDASRIEVPIEVDEELRAVIDNSPSAAAIKEVLKKHGMSVKDVCIDGTLLFKDTLAGKEWSEIAHLPDAGVLAPGVVRFWLDDSRKLKPGQ